MPNDPMTVVRNAGLESLFAPQIIDENNNMSAGYTPSFNAQGYLIDPRAGTAANDAPAGTPYYKQGPNGDAFMLDQSGQWVDSGQPFNNVEHGFGPLAMIQELSPMIMAALPFTPIGALLAETLGTMGASVARSAIGSFISGGDISPQGLLTSAATAGAMEAAGGVFGDPASVDYENSFDSGAMVGAANSGADIVGSVLDDNPAIYGDLIGGGQYAAAPGATTDSPVYDTPYDPASSVDYENSFDTGAMVGAGGSGADIASPPAVGSALVDTYQNSFDDGSMAGANNSGADTITGSPAAAGDGLLNRVVDWAKENKQLATGIVTAGAGLLGGIGASMGADERLDKTIEAQKDLIREKAAAELQALEDKRKHVQSGSYWSGKFGYKAPTGPLRRPDGSLVFKPGGGLLNR